MSITVNAVHRRVQYTGNGSNLGPFSFSFKVLAAGDIKVSEGTTTKTVTTHYTTSLNADGTGTVTFTSGNAPANNAIVTIESDQAIERTTDYSTGGDFTAASINDALDRLTINDQQIETLLSRNIQLPATVNRTTSGTGTSGPLFFPYADTASDQASKLIAYDSNGTALETTTGRVNTVAVSNVAVDGSGNSQSATVSFNSSTGALSLGVPVGSTGAGGSTGSQGPDGVGGLPYTFSTTTSDADPGAGQIRLNNGTLGSVSQIFIDDSTAASGNPDVSAFVLTWDDSTQTSDRGQVTITKKSAQQNFATYKISGASTDASGYVKLAVTHVVSNGSFSNSDAVLVSFVRTGNAGSLADPMTTRGDIIVRDSSNATARLAVGSANTVLKSDGTDASWGYTVGTSANNLVQLNGSAALPAVSGANLTNLPASGGTVDLVADGSITAGKPVAITSAGKVKQISATGFTSTEVIGSTVASSSRNFEYTHVVYDEGNNEVISVLDGSGSTYFARVTLAADMDTAYTGELTYSHGGTYLHGGVAAVYNPAVDRIFIGPYRFSSTSGCYLLRNNSGTLSGTASETFGGSSVAYGTVDVCRSTGIMFAAYQNGSTSNNSAAMGFVDTSVDEQVRWGHDEALGAMNYGQSYSYFGALRWIPDAGLIFMRNITGQGTEFIYLPSSQWNKDQTDVQSASNSGGTRPRFGRQPDATGDPALNHLINSGSDQTDYPHGSIWHPWAKRLIMGGRSKAGTDGRISTISFQNGVASHSYGISFTGLPQMYFAHGPLYVPIPNTNAFAIVFADDGASNALKYCVVDIKLGENAGEDAFVISAEREISSASHDAFGGVWNSQRNAMVVTGRTSSDNKYYGVTPQLAVSNARNFIGFASASVSDTQTLTVHLPGAINENQSSLTPGRRYLVGHDGNLIEQNNHTGKSQGMPVVGTAISATKIMVGA